MNAIITRNAAHLTIAAREIMHTYISNLRILTGKKQRQIKLQRLQKVGIRAFEPFIHQMNSLEEILKLKQNFQKNKVVTSKTPFFVTGPSCGHHSNCLNIGF